MDTQTQTELRAILKDLEGQLEGIKARLDLTDEEKAERDQAERVQKAYERLGREGQYGF